jgi:hypothetical protein
MEVSQISEGLNILWNENLSADKGGFGKEPLYSLNLKVMERIAGVKSDYS